MQDETQEPLLSVQVTDVYEIKQKIETLQEHANVDKMDLNKPKCVSMHSCVLA